MDKLLVVDTDLQSERICKIADHLNIDYEIISEHTERIEDSHCALIVSRSHARIAERIPNVKVVLEYYDTLVSVSEGGGTFRVGHTRPDITGQLTGLTFTSRSEDSGILNDLRAPFDTLIQLNGQPYFVLKKHEDKDWYYWGQRRILDLDSVLDEMDSSPPILPFELIPIIMFLKFTFGIKFPAYACLIIDDPCLWKRYGFIDFARAAVLAREEEFSFTIAFIPWNHHRSRRGTVRLFRENEDRLSICVHGCDHTKREFGNVDHRFLSWKLSLARKRMEAHQKRFGLPYDNVMVFPQGVFSIEAMGMLKQLGYAAAVNTDLWAANYKGGLTLRELLSPATAYYGSPLFLRHHAKELKEIAIDLFLGRPVLVVQHNLDFSDGWKTVLGRIRKIKELDPDLKWAPLGTIVSKYVQVQSSSERRALPIEMNYSLLSFMTVLVRRLLCDVRDHIIHRFVFRRKPIPSDDRHDGDGDVPDSVRGQK